MRSRLRRLRLIGPLPRGLLVITTAIAGIVMTALADAAFPPDPPNDPGYPPASGCPPPGLPMPQCAGPTGQWNLFSYWPNNPPDPGQASGISADLAWNTTTGDPDVTVVVLDTGVNYDHEDLRNKIWLNRGELPVPNPVGGCPSAPPGDAFDCNGDGVFSIKDYAGDLAVPDQFGTGLSRADLRVFEDGIDDDGNGFVDDISGWDARDGDGDEYRTNGDGHGTGRNGFIGAEANNGKGIAGICPECTLANVRVDGSFVTRTEGPAIGAIWAADNGHEVINMALGATSASSMSRAAFDYATQKNVLALNASANEFSFHHNFQTVFDDVMAIGGVVPDLDTAAPEILITTYLRKANFSNYGAHLDVVTPSDAPTTGGGDASYGDSSGTSSSVPHAAGVAGLVFSRARELIAGGTLNPSGLALQDISADEVKQIINGTADDVVQTDDPAGPYQYQTGWDRWTGYGRINANDAVLAVSEGTIPPEADINSPDWYKKVNGAVDVGFYANARWETDFDWVLEYGSGVEPASFTQIGSGNNVASDPSLSSANLASNFSEAWNTAALSDGFYTLRLRVTDNLGNTSEDRMGVWVQAADAQAHSGWPKSIPASIESVSGAHLVDLDGNNTLEIVISTGDGQIRAFRHDGTELPGFPLTTEPVASLPTCPGCSDAFDGNTANGEVPITGSSVVGGVTVADIDIDGQLEICAGAYNGKLYCWNHNGGLQPGFPVETDKGVTIDQYTGAPKFNARGEALLTPPGVGDLDGDGDFELVAGAFDQKVYIWRPDGTRMAPWPKQIFDPVGGSVSAVKPKEIISHPMVADIDTDPEIEIVFGTNETYSTPNVAGQGGSGRVYAYEPDGSLEPGWPVKPTSIAPSAVPLVADGVGTSPGAADIDNDGSLEIATGLLLGDPTIYNHDGTVFRTMSGAMGGNGPGGDGEETTPEGGLGKASDDPVHYYVALGAFADVEGDGAKDYMVGTIGTGIAGFALSSGAPAPFDHYFSVWDATSGTQKPAFPRVMEDWQFFTGPAVADIDGAPGGLPEMVVGSGGYFVHAFNAAGLEPAGWPKNLGQWVIMSPSVGDLDGDGQLEVVVATRMGDIHVYDMAGAACGNVQWRKAGHDEWNSAVLGTDTLRPNAVLDLGTGTNGLAWTAPGDDGACGQAAQYLVRRSTSPITTDNFDQAEAVGGAPAPAPAGSAQTMPLPSELKSYFYAVRSADTSSNVSAISNVILIDGPDEDEDGVADIDEINCGGNYLNAALRPERIDGAFAGVDDDGDTEIDEPLAPSALAFDCDGDGFKGIVENHVYGPSTLGDQDPCGSNSFPATDPPSPIGWPLDLRGDSPSTANEVDVADLGSFVVPVRRIQRDTGTIAGDHRWDLVPGSSASPWDINIADMAALVTTRTGYPPMLKGARAFGAVCPWGQ